MTMMLCQKIISLINESTTVPDQSYQYAQNVPWDPISPASMKYTPDTISQLMGIVLPSLDIEKAIRYLEQSNLIKSLQPEVVNQVRQEVREKLKNQYLNQDALLKAVWDSLKMKGFAFPEPRWDSEEAYYSEFSARHLAITYFNKLIPHFYPDDVPVYRSVSTRWAGLPNLYGYSYWGVGEKGLQTAVDYKDSKFSDIKIIKSNFSGIRSRGIPLYDDLAVIGNATQLWHPNHNPVPHKTKRMFFWF